MAKKRKERTRGAGTLTEAQFWQMIRSSLRKTSRWWKPMFVCKMNARRKYKGKNKRQKWEYKCNSCKKWFPAKKMNIDHIIPVGKLNCAKDLPGFVERLFCETEGLQLLCSNCHDLKTKKEKDNDNKCDKTTSRRSNRKSK